MFATLAFSPHSLLQNWYQSNFWLILKIFFETSTHLECIVGWVLDFLWYYLGVLKGKVAVKIIVRIHLSYLQSRIILSEAEEKKNQGEILLSLLPPAHRIRLASTITHQYWEAIFIKFRIFCTLAPSLFLFSYVHPELSVYIHVINSFILLPLLYLSNLRFVFLRRRSVFHQFSLYHDWLNLSFAVKEGWWY